MLRAIYNFVNKPEWHEDAFDEEKFASWRNDSMNIDEPMTEETWDWCRREVQDKARLFHSLKYVHLFDAGSQLCMSDSLIDQGIVQS